MSFYTKGKVTDCLIDATRGCLVRSVYKLKSLIQTIKQCLNDWEWISDLYFIQRVLGLISSVGKSYDGGHGEAERPLWVFSTFGIMTEVAKSPTDSFKKQKKQNL